MSLDVTLRTDTPVIREHTSGIFVRENGQTKEISEGEWMARHPGMEPVRFDNENLETTEVYSANITHNLNKMAMEAGIYEHLWRPDEINITKAKELIEPLRQGLHELLSRREHFEQFNPDNGWGDYEGLVRFVDNYLKACYAYPEANVEADR